MTVRIMVGGALSQLAKLPDASLHCVVTSPPYWGLRSYKGDTWEGGDPGCDHMRPTPSQHTSTLTGGPAPNASNRMEGWPGGVCGKCGGRRTGVMIGLEPTFAEHLDNLVAVFREVRRVLRSDGSLWLNYGDAYAANMKGSGGKNAYSAAKMSKGAFRDKPVAMDHGLKPKDLMMMPARVAIALQADGWWLRSEIIWHKPNPMPESATDRPTSAHEKLFLLSKSARYFYDAEAVRVQGGNGWHGDFGARSPERRDTPGLGAENGDARPSGSNLRNVWKIATHAYSEAHFATFPPALVEPCIKAGTSAHGVCGECGAPWVREVEKKFKPQREGDSRAHISGTEMGQGWEGTPRGTTETSTTGWFPTCDHDAAVVPATCLDPFAGSGTVGLVADRLQRDAILIEISPEYADMARRRIDAESGVLFGPAVAAE